ncbi:MAG: hypothetical protein ABI612_19085 [Betaproteobacteria bacterium]
MADRYTSTLEQEALTDFIVDGHLERYLRRAKRVKRNTAASSGQRDLRGNEICGCAEVGASRLQRFAPIALMRERGQRCGGKRLHFQVVSARGVATNA